MTLGVWCITRHSISAGAALDIILPVQIAWRPTGCLPPLCHATDRALPHHQQRRYKGQHGRHAWGPVLVVPSPVPYRGPPATSTPFSGSVIVASMSMLGVLTSTRGGCEARLLSPAGERGRSRPYACNTARKLSRTRVQYAQRAIARHAQWQPSAWRPALSHRTAFSRFFGTPTGTRANSGGALSPVHSTNRLRLLRGHLC